VFRGRVPVVLAILEARDKLPGGMKRRIGAVLLVVLVAACGLDAVGGREDATAGGAGAESGASLPDGTSIDGTVPGDDATSDGTVADAALPDQGLPDAPGPDVLVSASCPAAQVRCGGACVAGNDCTSCASGKLFCKALRTCLTTCETCTDLASAPVPIECVACDMQQNNPIGTCEPNAASTFCLSGDYGTAHNGAPGKQCDCSGTMVANCTAGAQTCHTAGSTDFCSTCGEVGASTNGKTCKNGKTCNTGVTPPRCE
jgi:hypothetical protein